MKKVFGTILLSCFVLVSYAHKADSIGTKVKDGKVYVMHRVEAGDGLYNVSKRYAIPLKTLVDANPGSEEVIKIGQILLIPTSAKPVMQEKVVTEYFEKPQKVKEPVPKDRPSSTDVSTFGKYHVVELGETMYSISKKYNTSVDMIMSLNNLKEPALSTGQKLLVQNGAAPTIKVDVEKEVSEIQKELDMPEYEDLGFDTAVETSETQSPSGYTIKVEKLVEYNIEKIEETGTGTIGSSSLDPSKNFAEHFNAPIGTVIMVTNPKSGQSVFVKITGNFQRNDSSSQIIRLTQRSASQIAFENKGALELSYAK